MANISHELRTPLNSIIAFNSLLLEDDTLSEAQREFVSSAIVSAEALLGIIGQILDFAKLESGSVTHQELVIESFDVNAMMNELVDIVGKVVTPGCQIGYMVPAVIIFWCFYCKMT